MRNLREKSRIINRQTLIPLGMVLMLGKPAASLIWNASAAFSEMRSMKPKVEHLEQLFENQDKLLVKLQVTQAGMLQAIQDLRGPVYHTHEDVKHIRNSFAKFEGPLELHRRDVCERYNPGQFSMMEKGR